MKLREKQSALSDALAQFEKCLETPVIPGELPGWCQRATAACDDVHTHLRRAIDIDHPELFRQIRHEDPALAARVEALRESDDEVIEQLGQVEQYFEHLCQLGADVEPDEAKVDEYVEKAVDKGLALVLAIRKQETAITTWYMEALQRDRGVVD